MHSLTRTATVDDVLHLANGIAAATESLPCPAQRAEALVDLIAHGLLRSNE